jgi:hypothetical protein
MDTINVVIDAFKFRLRFPILGAFLLAMHRIEL